jgi:hypothetical protein
MPPRRKSHESNSRERDSDDTPTLQDDADILAEAGAEPDEETGELAVNSETVRELGAVDATSVRENRRLTRVVQKKREGKKDVPFNTKDVVVIYGTLLQYWTPDSIDITAKRMLGGATTMFNKPISGAALYEAIMHFHGQHAEAEYEIKFTSSGKYLGMGRITMPDTRPAAQQGQPMNNGYPNGVQPPLGYAPIQAQPYPPQQPSFPQATPMAQAAPQAFDPMAMMRQMFEMFQQMQTAVQPPQPQVQPQFQSPPVMPPMPSPQSSPAEMMAWMQQAFGIFQQMQGGAPRPAQIVAPSPPPAPAPQQPSEFERMREMFAFFRDMQASAAPRQIPRSFDPQRGAPPPYERPSYAAGPSQPPQRPPTMAEQFRESIAIVRSAVDVVQEMEGVLPGREQEMHSSSPEDDDSPVRVIDTGPAKIVVNKSDGSTRLWETGVANMDKIFKWVGEQREAIQKESAARQRQQAPQQQLPPGYVEVGPGYRPPPGYVAVPVDQQSDLPPPPDHMPPPIGEPPPSRQPWGVPPISSEDTEQQ